MEESRQNRKSGPIQQDCVSDRTDYVYRDGLSDNPIDQTDNRSEPTTMMPSTRDVHGADANPSDDANVSTAQSQMMKPPTAQLTISTAQSQVTKPPTAQLTTGALAQELSALNLGGAGGSSTPNNRPSIEANSPEIDAGYGVIRGARSTGGARPRRTPSIVDPKLRFLHKEVGDQMDSEMVKDIKYLLGPSNEYIEIPMSELEVIETGRELVSAIYKHVSYEYRKCLDTLIEIFSIQEHLVLKKRIIEEKEKVERSPERYAEASAKPYSERGEGRGEDSGQSNLKLLWDFPTEIPRLRSVELTKDKKLFLLSNGDIVYKMVERSPKKGDGLMFLIPKAVWTKVLDIESDIDRQCQSYRADYPHDKTKISGSTYIDIGSYKEQRVVSLKIFYGEPLKPSHVGTTLIFKTWAKFMEFLHESKKLLSSD